MAKTNPKLTFEQAMKRLDEIVAAMESGQIGIEESIARYEEAMQLAGHCRAILDQAEQRIKKIQLNAAGRLQTMPLEPLPEQAAEDEEDE